MRTRYDLEAGDMSSRKIKMKVLLTISLLLISTSSMASAQQRGKDASLIGANLHLQKRRAAA